MDQVKIGQFIAELRHKNGLTQEALGEKLGVTNKTVSRWENGNYMPDIEMLQLLGQTFDVSINELLAGQFLSDEEFKKKSDENIIAVSKESAFSFAEKRAYWIKKWRKEHIPLFILLAVIALAFLLIPFVLEKEWLIGFLPLVLILEYAWQNNKMMIYVENHLFISH